VNAEGAAGAALGADADVRGPWGVLPLSLEADARGLSVLLVTGGCGVTLLSGTGARLAGAGDTAGLGRVAG
jgi:hypothetical protein